MKNTINKYEADWQIIRAKVRDKKYSVSDKLELTKKYYEKRLTVEAHCRVFNWAKGLLLGYKACDNTEAMDRILQEIDYYDTIATSLLATESEDEVSEKENLKKLSQYDFQSRYTLWKDLYKRTYQWVSKGYYHNDNMLFIEVLYKSFDASEVEKIKENFSYSKLSGLIQDNKDLKNTHKFLFST